MRFVPVATILLFLLGACTGHSTAVDPANPVIGTWEFTAPGSNCPETSRYLPDGTGTFESADQKGQTRYQISATASPKGFYKLVDTLSESNEKPSCSGRAIPSGHVATVFLKFLPSLQEMTMCTSESDEHCVAKFVRRSQSLP